MKQKENQYLVQKQHFLRIQQYSTNASLLSTFGEHEATWPSAGSSRSLHVRPCKTDTVAVKKPECWSNTCRKYQLWLFVFPNRHSPCGRCCPYFLLKQPCLNIHLGMTTGCLPLSCKPAAPVRSVGWTTEGRKGREHSECHRMFFSLLHFCGFCLLYLTDVDIAWSTGFKEIHFVVLGKLQQSEAVFSRDLHNMHNLWIHSVLCLKQRSSTGGLQAECGPVNRSMQPAIFSYTKIQIKKNYEKFWSSDKFNWWTSDFWTQMYPKKNRYCCKSITLMSWASEEN